MNKKIITIFTKMFLGSKIIRNSKNVISSTENNSSNLRKKLKSGVVGIRMSWVENFQKINSRGGTSIQNLRVRQKKTLKFS